MSEVVGADADGVIAELPKLTPRQRLERRRTAATRAASITPAPVVIEAKAEPVTEPGPPAAPKPMEGGEHDAFVAVFEEARAALQQALERDAIHSTEARWFVGAIAAAVAVIDALEKRIAHLEASLPVAIDKLIREGEERVRSPHTPEERAALRAEFVKAGMGAIPTQEERAAAVKSMVAAMETTLGPVVEQLQARERALAERERIAIERASAPVEALPAPKPEPSATPEELRRASAAGAKLAVAEALSADVIQRIGVQTGKALAVAFAVGSGFGVFAFGLLWFLGR